MVRIRPGVEIPEGEVIYAPHPSGRTRRERERRADPRRYRTEVPESIGHLARAIRFDETKLPLHRARVLEALNEANQLATQAQERGAPPPAVFQLAIDRLMRSPLMEDEAGAYADGIIDALAGRPPRPPTF